MGILEAAQGLALTDTAWDIGENFVALGPIAGGVIIERVEFLLNVTVAATIDVSAVLTAASLAGLAAFQSGRPLFRAAQLTGSAVAALEVFVEVNSFQVIAIPVGLVVASGGQWVHFSYESNQAANSVGLFTVWTVARGGGAERSV